MVLEEEVDTLLEEDERATRLAEGGEEDHEEE